MCVCVCKVAVCVCVLMCVCVSEVVLYIYLLSKLPDVYVSHTRMPDVYVSHTHRCIGEKKNNMIMCNIEKCDPTRSSYNAMGDCFSFSFF